MKQKMAKRFVKLVLGELSRCQKTRLASFYFGSILASLLQSSRATKIRREVKLNLFKSIDELIADVHVDAVLQSRRHRSDHDLREHGVSPNQDVLVALRVDGPCDRSDARRLKKVPRHRREVRPHGAAWRRRRPGRHVRQRRRLDRHWHRLLRDVAGERVTRGRTPQPDVFFGRKLRQNRVDSILKSHHTKVAAINLVLVPFCVYLSLSFPRQYTSFSSHWIFT